MCKLDDIRWQIMIEMDWEFYENIYTVAAAVNLDANNRQTEMHNTDRKCLYRDHMARSQLPNCYQLTDSRRHFLSSYQQ